MGVEQEYRFISAVVNSRAALPTHGQRRSGLAGDRHSRYSPPVPAHDNGSIQRYRASLTTREHREFARAERTIATGLKSFLEVGMALKEIRDKRLYRQQFDTFEEYCVRRWELSRPRAYQLCAASEVVTHLSTNVDTRLLPESEAQARPLMRLKDPAQWRRAWRAAVKLAAAGWNWPK
jgi:hypothetical protein